MSKITRRALLGGAAGLAAASTGALAWREVSQPQARVTVRRVLDYGPGLSRTVQEVLSTYPELARRAKGARVVLKPNLVEFHPDRPVNTHPVLVGAVAEAFFRLGAKQVIVAEGPGHRRDTELLVEGSGLDVVLRDIGVPFVDLNVDPPRDVTLRHDHTGLGRLRLAGTAVGADLLVSVAKMKTHHWAGATLSMKNLFGVVPGAVYGWPKNPLHWAGIDNAVFDLWSTLTPAFAIVDGVVAMEGDGPLKGEAVPMGCIVLGDQCPAVDATCARLMGLNPERIRYLNAAMWAGGTVSARRIELLGETVEARAFKLLPHLEHFRA
ncbi:MAG: hypothetical protein RIT28_1468 [Pseudomonadota bacterium]